MKTPAPQVLSFSSDDQANQAERIRLTITVTPEVHRVFSRLAAASGQSLGRAMGDWLGDTLEAADYVANLAEKAREAPKMVMRELHAYALGLADETGALMRKVAAERPGTLTGGARSAHPAADLAAPPRPVIRGGKSSGKARGQGGKAS